MTKSTIEQGQTGLAIRTALNQMLAELYTAAGKVFPAGAYQVEGPWGPAAQLFVDGDGKQGYGLDKYGNLVVSDLVINGSISGSQIDRVLRRRRNIATTDVARNVVNGRVMLNVEPNMGWIKGDRLRVSAKDKTSQWMEGTVVHYQGGLLILYADTSSNVLGSYTQWIITPASTQSGTIVDLGLPAANRGVVGQQYLRSDTGGLYVRTEGGWYPITSGPAVVPSAIYVSNVNVLGIPVGNDTTGTGTATNPYLTLEKALAVAPVNALILLNGSPYLTGVYKAATQFAITKGVTIDAVLPYGATLQSTTTSSIFALALPNGTIFSLGQVSLQCAGASAVVLPDNAAGEIYGLAMTGTRVFGWTGDAIGRSGTSAGGIYVMLYNCRFTGAQAARCVRVTAANQLYADIQNCTFSISQQTTSSAGIIELACTGTSLGCDIGRNQISSTLQSTLSGSGTHYGVSLTNVKNAMIWGNEITVEGAYGDRNGCPIRLTADLTTPLDSSGFQIFGNYTYSGCMGGYNIKIGEESGLTNASGYLNGGEIHHNYAYGTGTKAAQVGALHGLFVGSRANTKVHHNWVQQTGIGLVCKSGLNDQWFANVVVDAYSAALVIKGSTNSWMHHNTVVNLTATGNMVQVTDNDVTSEDSANVSYMGNLFVTLAPNTGGIRYTQQQTCTQGYNCWVALRNGGWLNNSFKFNAAGLVARNQPAQSGIPESYNTQPVDWIAQHEPLSVSGDPNLLSIDNLEFDLARASLSDALVPPLAGVLSDYNGRAFDPTAASIGAYSLYW